MKVEKRDFIALTSGLEPLPDGGRVRTYCSQVKLRREVTDTEAGAEDEDDDEDDEDDLSVVPAAFCMRSFNCCRQSTLSAERDGEVAEDEWEIEAELSEPLFAPLLLPCNSCEVKEEGDD